jgi:deoxyhypusine synthase
VSIRRFTEELGRANAAVNDREGVDEGPGIAAAAYEHDVPVYCPAVQDSVLGLQAWMYGQTSAFTLDALADMDDITDQAFEADEAGALLVGGGVPKNYTLQTMLVAPDAYDYAVQLTMDPPQTGGLSGATLDEARSWGKLEKAARNASVYADATITFPLLVAAARERLDSTDGNH